MFSGLCGRRWKRAVARGAGSCSVLSGFAQATEKGAVGVRLTGDPAITSGRWPHDRCEKGHGEAEQNGQRCAYAYEVCEGVTAGFVDQQVTVVAYRGEE